MAKSDTHWVNTLKKETTDKNKDPMKTFRSNLQKGSLASTPMVARRLSFVTKNNLAHFLMTICLFIFGAALAHAQIPNVVAQAPPGTTAVDIAGAIGWVRFIFGILAVALIIFGLISVAKHPATGITELVGAVVCIVMAANAQGIVSALYHNGSG